MPCQRIRTPLGWGFVCTGRGKPLRICACGASADRLCDWKLGDGRTCYLPICSSCSTTPAADKDLCREHARAWDAWKAGRK